MHDALITPEDPHEYDDIYWFVDHWIIVGKDGTPILNGTPEQFTESLRAFMKELNE